MEIEQSTTSRRNTKSSSSAWKGLYGQVFRHPEYPVAFACCVGAGSQIFMMFYFTLNAFVFFFSSESLRPPVYTIVMGLLAVMGIVNGLVTMRLLKFFGMSDFYLSAIISSVGLPIFIYICLSIELIANAKSGAYTKSTSLWSLIKIVFWTITNGICCFFGAYKGFTMARI